MPWITIDSALLLLYFQETTDYAWILLLREIVFAKSKVYVKGYQETLHSELLPFIAEIEDKKTMFRQDDAPFHRWENVVSKFRSRITAMDNIKARFETDREPMGHSGKRSLRSGEATYRKYRWT